jgi:hypothetical protein
MNTSFWTALCLRVLVYPPRAVIPSRMSAVPSLLSACPFWEVAGGMPKGEQEREEIRKGSMGSTDESDEDARLGLLNRMLVSIPPLRLHPSSPPPPPSSSTLTFPSCPRPRPLLQTPFA